MKVTLINYTRDAVETLLFTKSTRLKMTPSGLADIKAWPEEKKAAELEYMRHTIQSQFEFVDYMFMIEDVSRAFTHQLVRHRVGTSFAQQTQRSVDMTGFDYITGPSIKSELQDEIYHVGMEEINRRYQQALEAGVNPQDARGLLPTNICTNIVFKANLRTLHDMALKRLCVKTQGEFQDVFRAIRAAIMEVHPWAEKFIRVWCATYGTCQFHNFPAADCPVKPWVFNPQSGKAYAPAFPILPPDRIQAIWEAKRGEAQPMVPQEE